MTLLRPRTTNHFPKLRGGASPLDVVRCPDNPLLLLQRWTSHVLAIEAVEPMFVTLATASADGIPSSRTVQLLEISDEALLFTTNMGSRKGVEMAQTGRAAVSIYWRETGQSVNATGTVIVADDAECDARFAEDSRGVQVARTVSFHGRPLQDEAAHQARYDALFASGAPIPRPSYWKWFRIVPDGVTFWEGHPETMNRRVHYAREAGRWRRGAIEA